MKRLLLTLILCLYVLQWSILAQRPPRLVVGITVDQMRYDYLYKYWDDYGNDGFKRLLREGFSAEDTHYHYAPTYTGPGHASIYTGTGPAHHGIAGNEWYDRRLKRTVYCVEDDSVNPVGEGAVEGKASPRFLRSTTMADQLELATNHRAITLGVAIKDRGAILPVGFHSDGAFWLDKASFSFISSSFYMDTLPRWVKDFNDKQMPDSLLQLGWSLLNQDADYEESQPDSAEFELPFRNTEKAVFPYDLKKISETRVYGVGESAYDVLASSPHGNTLTLSFAKTAIIATGMGTDDIPDLIAISLSSPDYAGHRFGPHSREIQDMYLRLDQELAKFLKFLDEYFGKENVLVFLTADHGAADVPAFVGDPAGYFKKETFENGLRNFLKFKMGEDPVEYFINQQIYFKQSDSIDLEKAKRLTKVFAMRFPGVLNIIDMDDWSTCGAYPSVCDALRKGHVPGRSGDLYIQLLPGWLDYNSRGGTTHGSPYAYDTHVPLIFWGWHVKHEHSLKRTWIEDIAPTICQVLRISLPSGATGKPIEVFSGRY